MPKTFSYSRYLRGYVKDASRDEKTSRPIVAVFASAKENAVLIFHRLDLILGKLDIVVLSLLPSEFQKISAIHCIWEPKIILHFRFPLRHGMAGINHKSVALCPPEVDCSRKSRDPAADNDRFSQRPVTEFFWFYPIAHIGLSSLAQVLIASALAP